MPHMTQGIGTWFCKAHFDAGWGWDDAVECAMFFYFPVWPLRTLHLQEIPGGSFAVGKYRAIPLRWSDQLVRHVICRRWLTGLIGLGALFLFLLGLFTWLPMKENTAREWTAEKPIFAVVAPCLVLAGIVGRFILRSHARRERDIRCILGPHALGSSDPVTWVVADLARIPKAEAVFGTKTYAAAVPNLLTAGAWVGAMWASRLAAALESRSVGEELTEAALQDSRLREALARFRRDATCWRAAMGVDALIQYQTRQLGAAQQPLFDPVLAERLAQHRATDQRNLPGIALVTVSALTGTGVGVWLGSMLGVWYIAPLCALLGFFVGAAAGFMLAVAVTNR